jgi:uncharacterized RDD family membrane protein YckC
MKCPKCDYLGFETGDRCRNCGYDFSLSSVSSAPAESDLPLRDPNVVEEGPNQWLDQFGREVEVIHTRSMSGRSADPLAPMQLDTVVAARPVTTSAAAAPVQAPRTARRAATPPLPLFHPGGDDDDQPLIKLPAAPRPPLAVRRTPDTPRLRTVARPVRHVEPDPVLQFAEDPAAETPIRVEAPVAPKRIRPALITGETSGPFRRLLAAGIDHAILLTVDSVVAYFTLKMAALTLGDWRLLPPVPLFAFLAMVKIAYFCAFTLVGGQTIGKMAVRIRVITDANTQLDPPTAIRRTLAGAASLLAFGLGFLPVLFAADRRALHDRIARTRVIAQE